MANRVEDFLGSGLGTAITGIGALGAIKTAYDDLGDIGSDARTYANELAQTQMGQTQFQPYTITGAQGGTYGAGADGQYQMNLSPEQMAMSQNLFGQAGGFLDAATMDPAARTQNIFGNMMTAMQPDMQRQQLMNEERMAAQGRLGVQSNMFGGMAPENFAMNKAQQEAMNNAYFQATQQARAEQAQQAGLGAQYMGLGYMPQNQLLAQIQPGMTSAAAQQQAQMYGAGLFGESTMSGIDAYLASGLGQANLLGNIGSGLLTGLLQPPSNSGGININLPAGATT
jgi:hypothetical protein